MAVFESTAQIAKRLARSRVLTAVLLAGSAVFVLARWQDAEWDSLADADLLLLAAAGATYAGSLAGLIAIVALGNRRMVAAGASTQLLKYLPGGVWQSQPLLSAGSVADVGVYAWGVLTAAGTAAALGADGFLAAFAALSTLIAVAFGLWRFGVRTGSIRAMLAISAGAAIVASGALASTSLGGPGWPDGRDVGLSWATGVLAIPVPVGLGVREATLAVLGGSETAALAAAHRLVTFVVDMIVGVAGFATLRTGRSRPIIRSDNGDV